MNQEEIIKEAIKEALGEELNEYVVISIITSTNEITVSSTYAEDPQDAISMTDTGGTDGTVALTASEFKDLQRTTIGGPLMHFGGE